MLDQLKTLNAEMFNTGGMTLGDQDKQPPAMYFTNQAKARIDALEDALANGEPHEEIEAKLGEITLSLDLLATRLGCALEGCIHKGFRKRADIHHFEKKEIK